MLQRSSLLAIGLTAVTVITLPAHAQSQDFDQLMGLDDSALEGELTTRYDAGLAATEDPGYISADDPRYLWALETKVQCGIALGFMKSSTRDATSIRNCAIAYMRMNEVPAPPPPVAVAPPPPPPVQRPDICDDDIVGMIFFDFDSTEILTEAGSTLNNVVSNIEVCGWNSLTVVGHTDQAGSDAYNIGLSEERANVTEAALRSRMTNAVPIDVSGQGESNPRVPLPDGTRSPQNRRVEISAD